MDQVLPNITVSNLMYYKIVSVLEKKTEQECLNDILDILIAVSDIKKLKKSPFAL